MGVLNDHCVYNAFARHLYQVRIQGSGIQYLYPTIELAYAAGYLGTTKPYNDFFIKIQVSGEEEKFLFKINASDRDWFKDLNDRVARRLGRPHVTVQLGDQPLNQVSLYTIAHNDRNTIYSVAYVQADIPIYVPEVNSIASSSSSSVVEKNELQQVIAQFLKNALDALVEDIKGNSSNNDLSIGEWLDLIRSHGSFADFISSYYKTYRVQINGGDYSLSEIFKHHKDINQSHLVNIFQEIATAFRKEVIDQLNAKLSVQDKKASLPIIQATIKKLIAGHAREWTFENRSTSTNDNDDADEELTVSDDDDDDDEPIESQLRFIGVKFNIPLPSLSRTKSVLQNTKNVITNVTSKSKFVEFSLASPVSKGRVSTLVQNVVSEVEPGDVLRYRVLPGTEPQWVRVDIEESRADYRGNFPRDSWKIVTSNKIRRPASVAVDAPYMTFPLAWAKYRVRVYIERKDAPGRWKLEGERNFNCSVKGGKTGNEFTWAQLREVLNNRGLWEKLKLDNEIQNMRVANRPPFVYRETEDGPTFASFPEGAMKCLQSAWEIDEGQQGDDSVALVFWSALKKYAEEKAQRILRSRALIWAYFSNARLDARPYETQPIDNPVYEEEYTNAPVTAKGECPYDGAEDAIAAGWFSSLPPLTSAIVGFTDYAAKTRNVVANAPIRDLDLPQAKKAELERRPGRVHTPTLQPRPVVPVPAVVLPQDAPRRQVFIETQRLNDIKKDMVKNRRIPIDAVIVIDRLDNVVTKDSDLDTGLVTVELRLPVFTLTYTNDDEYAVTNNNFVVSERTRFSAEKNEYFFTYGEFNDKFVGRQNVAYFLIWRNGYLHAQLSNSNVYDTLHYPDSSVCGIIVCDESAPIELVNTVMGDVALVITGRTYDLYKYITYVIADLIFACRVEQLDANYALDMYLIRIGFTIDPTQIKITVEGDSVILELDLFIVDISKDPPVQQLKIRSTTRDTIKQVFDLGNDEMLYRPHEGKLVAVPNDEKANAIITNGWGILLRTPSGTRVPNEVITGVIRYATVVRAENYSKRGSPPSDDTILDALGALRNLKRENLPNPFIVPLLVGGGGSSSSAGQIFGTENMLEFPTQGNSTTTSSSSIPIVNNTSTQRGAPSSSSSSSSSTSSPSPLLLPLPSPPSSPERPPIVDTKPPVKTAARSRRQSPMTTFTAGFITFDAPAATPMQSLKRLVSAQFATFIPLENIKVDLLSAPNEYSASIEITVQVYTDDETFYTLKAILYTNGAFSIENRSTGFIPKDEGEILRYIVNDITKTDAEIRFLTAKTTPRKINTKSLFRAGVYAIIATTFPGSTDFINAKYNDLVERYNRVDNKRNAETYAFFESGSKGEYNIGEPIEEWIGHYAGTKEIFGDLGAHLIFLPSDTRHISAKFAAEGGGDEEHVNKYSHSFPYSDSFAKHTRKLDPIYIDGQKLIVRRNYNKEAGRLEISVETEDGFIHTVPATTYVDEANRLVISIPSSAFLKF